MGAQYQTYARRDAEPLKGSASAGILVPEPAENGLAGVVERPSAQKTSIAAYGLPSAIGLFLCVAMPLSLVVNIWIDEAYSLLTTSRDLDYTLKHSSEFETQPPFYYILLWVWRGLNDSIPFARLSSVLTAAAAIWAVHVAVRRWVRGISPNWLTIPFAINTSLLYAATEIRTYALVILMSALLLVLFHDGFFAEPSVRMARVFYFVLAFAVLNTFYYLSFALVAGAAVLLVEKRWRTLLSYTGWTGVAALLFLPGFLQSREHVGNVSHAIVDMPGLPRTVEMVASRLLTMPFSLVYLPDAVKWTGMVGTAFIVVGSLWMLRSRMTREIRALWVWSMTIALFYGLVVKLVMGELVLTRHFLPLVVPSTLAVFSVIGLYQSRRKLVLGLWVTVVLASNLTADFIQFGSLAKKGDYRRVARYLEANEKPGQSIVIVASHAELPFRYYYKGTSDIVPLPEQDDYVNYVFEEWQLENPEMTREQLAAAVSDEGLLWVFSDRPPDEVFFGVDLNFEILEEILEADYRLERESEFYFAKVRLYSRRHDSGAEPGRRLSSPVDF